MIRLQIALLLLLATPSISLSQEWTRFRGPNGGGVGQGASIPAKWTKADYNWTLDLPGRGHSSPVLWGNKLFLVSADEKTGQRLVLGVDAQAGKLLWTRRYEAASHRKHRKNSYATSTPAVDQERLYVCWAVPGRLSMAALTHAGQEAWRVNLGSFKGNHGFGVSPVVVDGLVILANDQDGESSILALDKKTGQTRWNVSRRSLRTTYSTPCLFRPAGRPAELIFTNWQHGITSINPRDGATNWEISVFGKSKERAIGSPLTAGELVIGTCGFVTSDKHVVAVRPYDGGGKNVKEVFRIERAVPHVPTALAKDGLLYLWSDQGIVTCCELPQGKKLWQKRVGGNFSASPVYVNGRLYNVSEDGEVVVLAAGRKYQLLSRMQLEGQCYSTPAMALGRLFLRTTEKLYSVGGTNDK